MLFRTIGRNKKSVTLDLRTPEGRRPSSGSSPPRDVVIENFRPGHPREVGPRPGRAHRDQPRPRLGAHLRLRPDRPLQGPRRLRQLGRVLRRPALHHRRAGPPGRPRRGQHGRHRCRPLRGDRCADADAAEGARRQRPTGPQVVDVALYEGVFSLLESLVPDYDAYGMIRQRTGGRPPGVVPTGSYPAGDGLEVVIGGNSVSVFSASCAPSAATTSPRTRPSQTTEARSAREEELNGIISAWTGARPLTEALDGLNAAGVPAGPVYDAPHIADDEHYLARDMIETHEVVIEDEPEAHPLPRRRAQDPGSRGPGPLGGPRPGPAHRRGPAGANPLCHRERWPAICGLATRGGRRSRTLHRPDTRIPCISVCRPCQPMASVGLPMSRRDGTRR